MNAPWIGVMPRNGWSFVIISHSTTPKLYTSALVEYGSCRMTSGAIHRYVPVSAVKSDDECPISSTQLRPKSEIFTVPWLSSRTLPDLRSRCMMEHKCK